MKKLIPVNEPLLDGNEKKYLLECIDSGWISSEGPFVHEFEEKFAKYIGRKHAISVTNGTAAIDASIEALGITHGDEVIMPAFTIISCVNQIIRNGAVPVLIDSDPDTWNMNVKDIENKITKKTKAILVVHIYGLPVDIDPILDIAKKYNLSILEDAAEVHGQTYKQKLCGNFGDISTFSFYPNKHITTGEGGMILTDDDRLAEKCRSLRNLCFQENNRFVHESLGWNLRLTNIQAALGLAQLERIEEFILKKRKIGQSYTELLKDINLYQLPVSKTEFSSNIYWVFGIVLKDNKKFNAKSAMRYLQQKGIGTRPFFCPMNMQPVLLNKGLFKDEKYPNAENLYENGFYVPSGMALKKQQIEDVASALIEMAAE